MAPILDYAHIYRLSEELQQLVGAPLQAAQAESLTRYYLDFRLPGETRTLVLDLTPAQPFFLSTGSTKPKGKKQNAPVANFLRAHFTGHVLQRLEVAQKPNRTIRLGFGRGAETLDLIFHCYPHGQALVLVAGDKRVICPKKPFPAEELAYIEPEKSSGWEANGALALARLPAPGVPGALGVAGASAQPRGDGRIPKLEKALAQLDGAIERSKEESGGRIAELENQALVLRSRPPVDGAALDRLYDEIKKIKRKALTQQTRRNELREQLENLKKSGGQTTVAGPALPPKGGRKKVFAGTRIVLEEGWELWVGRNAAQNDELLRLCSPHDWWIHLRDYAGAHGVLRGPKRTDPPGNLEFACRVVALFSQGKKNPFAEGDKLDFIVTPLKFVKKPKGAAPGRVKVEREQVRRIAFKTVKFQVS